jgi:hypothetical protein
LKTIEEILSRIVEISTICNPENGYDVKEYAKSAIRDVFIQMPTRSVYQIYMPAYLNQISSTFGKKETSQAWRELKKEGWVISNIDKYFWKKVYGPVISGMSERAKINENEEVFFCNCGARLPEQYDGTDTSHVKCKKCGSIIAKKVNNL